MTDTAHSPHDRLGRLERSILCAVANHTVNIYRWNDATSSYEWTWGLDALWATVPNRKKTVARSVVYGDVRATWGGDVPMGEKRYAVSFSRAVHRLVEKRYLFGYALAWNMVGADVFDVTGPDWSGMESFHRWQGSRVNVRTTPPFESRDTPSFRMFSLTGKGWGVVERSRQRSPGPHPPPELVEIRE